MHIRVINIKKNGLVYRYAQLVEREYKSGKAWNRIIKHIGPVKSDADIERYKNEFLIADSILLKQNINFYSLNLAQPLEFGTYYTVRSLIKKTGLAKIIEKYLGDCAELAYLLISTRLSSSYGEQLFPKLLERVYHPWVTNTTREKLFKTLDLISKYKESIEKETFLKIAPTSKDIVLFLIPSRFITVRHPSSDASYKKQLSEKNWDRLLCVATVGRFPIFSSIWDKCCNFVDEFKKNVDILTVKFGSHNPKLVMDIPRTLCNISDIPESWNYIARLSRWINPLNNMLSNATFDSYENFGNVSLGVVHSPTDWFPDITDPIYKNLILKKSKIISLFSRELYQTDIDRFSSSEEGFYIDGTGVLNHKNDSNYMDQKDVIREMDDNLRELTPVAPSTLKKLSGKRVLLVDYNADLAEVASLHRFFVDLEKRLSSVRAFTELRDGFAWKETRMLAHLYINTTAAFIENLLEKETRLPISSVIEALSEMKAITVSTKYGPVILRNDSPECERILRRLTVPFPEKVVG